MQRAELQRYLEELLELRRLRDYCPNRLQVEGRESVEIIVTGVTAAVGFTPPEGLAASVSLRQALVLSHVC